MKICCYAYDKGPGGLLKMIGETAQVAGHDALVLPMQVRGETTKRVNELDDCDVLAVGLSSFQTEEELVLVRRALDLEIPVVVVEDVPGSSLRPKAKKVAKEIHTVYTAHPSVKEPAQDFGYEGVCYLGPPAHWGTSYAEMQTALDSGIRGRLKKQIGSEEPEELDPKDVVICVPGTKKPLVVNRLLRQVIESGRNAFEDQFVLGFRKHPGEKAEKPDEQEEFKRLFEERKGLLQEVPLLIGDIATNSQFVAAGDLVVYTGGPTESIVGAYAQRPAIYYTDPDVRAFLEESGVERGIWWVGECGGAMKAEGPNGLKIAITYLATNSGRAELKALQATNFPLPKTWETAPLVIKDIEDNILVPDDEHEDEDVE